MSKPMSKSKVSKRNKRLKSSVLTALTVSLCTPLAYGQVASITKSDSELQLAPDSPFRDPDIIYLEADELVNDQANNTLTAIGEVEGRYQDKTLRADKVRYDLNTGQVIALGSVVLVNADGSTQHAEKLELSGELEAGTAVDFIARFPTGGHLAAAFAKRDTEDGVELYNAYYTACEACRREDGKTSKPTWRLKARKVTQDQATNSIRYRDAVFEFKGVPIFYTPYLAHPDPSVGRATGLLIPFGGASGNKGINFRTPYYFALSPYSELTVTPRVYQKVNPLLDVEFRRKFYSGEFNFAGSATYSSFFDRDGDPFTDQTVFLNPEESLNSKKWRSSFYTNGLFNINEQWKWGFEAGYATDDNYLDRYDIDDPTPAFGLYEADSRRLMQQAFIVGQRDNFRFSTSAFGLVSLRTSIRENPIVDPITGLLLRDPITNEIIRDPNVLRIIREDDSGLPVVLPKIELNSYFKDPLMGGRFNVFGDATVLTRQHGKTITGELATAYTRASGGVEWQKNWIAPMGVEVKPFAMGRFDYFDLEAENEDSFDFSRTIGQIGVDIRWPFIRPGKNVDWILEPRVQLTNNFGDGKNTNFAFTHANGDTVNLNQDGIDIDLDQALLWGTNKSTGYDLWQKGFRVDVGGSLSANWGENSRALLFLGQSYYSGSDNVFGVTSGLQNDSSDLVGQFEVNLGRRFSSKTRVRYDDNDSAFRRLDTSLDYRGDRFQTNLRYYKIDSASTAPAAINLDPDFNPLAPTEELSGYISAGLFDNWSTKYQFSRDVDLDITRRQDLSLIYNDDCTRIEFIYSKEDNGLGLIGNSSSFGIRVSLLTLGDFAPE